MVALDGLTMALQKYNEIYDLVEVDRQLRGNAFIQELLKVHQKRRQKKKPPNEPTMDNERSKESGVQT
jgi:hypothetical protein